MTMEYLWRREADDLAKELCSRVRNQQTNLGRGCNLDAVRNSYNGFYNAYWGENARVGVTGEQDEYRTISVNHFGSLMQLLMNLITVQRLAFDVQTFRHDFQARETQKLAKAVLEMYFYERNYEEELRKALSLGLVMGTAHVGVFWEPKSKLYGVDEDDELFFAGRPVIKAYDLFSVFMANPYEDDDTKQPWKIVRERVNRWDLVAKYPKLEDKITALPKAESWMNFGRGGKTLLVNDEDDFVWLYRGYHRESPALPAGRMIEFCENDLLIEDHEKNPYVDPENESPNGGIPVFTFRPQIQHGSAYGFTPAFNMIAVQENINILDSTIATNQMAHGVQNIAVPRKAGMTSYEGGGARVFEFDIDPETGRELKPEILQLCATPGEVFNQRSVLVKDLETLSGLNATMRGRIETSNPLSGVAAALMTANGQMANSDIEYRYHRLVEKAARFFLYVIGEFQRVEDTVEVGESARIRKFKYFKGSDLKGVSNLKISLKNPMAATTAGRIGIAELGASQGLIKSAEQLAHIMTTGEVEAEFENNSSELALIRHENEQMFAGVAELPVVATDNHNIHILEHRVVALDPRARADAKVMAAYNKHMQQHLDILDKQMEDYPQLYTLITTQQPIMPTPSPESGVPAGVGGQPVGALSESETGQMEDIGMGDTAAAGGDLMAQKAQSGLEAAGAKLAEAVSQVSRPQG